MKKGICFFLCGIFIALSIWGQEQNEEEIRTLLLMNDDRSTKRHEEITFMKRVNMGMPGGDNWLVEWNNVDYSISRLVIVYAINNGEIIKRKSVVSNFSLAGHTEFDIMKDIPGTRIGSGSAAVHDYNGDGIDEVFVYGLYGSYFQIDIRGYDLGKDDFVGYFNVAFDIVDPVVGPAPVEFMSYKGMEGLKVYFDLYNQSPRHPPRNIINKYYAWYFFTWDGEKREYVEVEEVIDDPPAVTEPEEIAALPPAAEPDVIEDEIPATEPEVVTPAKPIIFAGIAGALIIAGALTVVLVLRKKKKKRA